MSAKNLWRIGALVLLALGLTAGLATRVNAAQTTITIDPLTVSLGGKVAGTIDGFQAGATISINGVAFTANGSGTVTLTGQSLLAASAGLHIVFTDSASVQQTVDVGLVKSSNGLALTLGDILGLLLGQSIVTSSTQVTVGTPSGTTTTSTTGSTTTTGATTTSSTTTTTTTSGGGSGGGSGGSGGGGGAPLTIGAGNVLYPNHLSISAVRFSIRSIRSRRPFTVVVTVRDAHDSLVNGARVSLIGVPTTRILRLSVRATAMSGTVRFTVRPTAKLRIVKGDRLTLYVRAARPGDPAAAKTSAKRLISLRVGT